MSDDPTTRDTEVVYPGVQIECASNPELNGTYAFDTETQITILSEMVSITTFGTFTDGEKLFDWPDMSGKLHTLTPETFIKLEGAIARYTTQLRRAGADSLPSQPIKLL